MNSVSKTCDTTLSVAFVCIMERRKHSLLKHFNYVLSPPCPQLPKPFVYTNTWFKAWNFKILPYTLVGV